jgi:hypothetical protein
MVVFGSRDVNANVNGISYRRDLITEMNHCDCLVCTSF